MEEQEYISELLFEIDELKEAITDSQIWDIDGKCQYCGFLEHDDACIIKKIQG